jgi:hypothetical protein
MLEPRAESAAVDEARRRAEALTRIALRPIASPTALGLFGSPRQRSSPRPS